MGVERQAFLRWELEKGSVMFLWFGVELRKPGWFTFLEGWPNITQPMLNPTRIIWAQKAH
ncbi:hypothetical protein C4D60_Mb08t04490 [Musa balbisiana]|uniref:Uncharacterized protein n=1 Tax=Musa balbisiana TaxID=52838 RepID=A0A4V4H8P8_MUSBA|nr:hypothetical protein C4D60_Mb08t04490 [Musa balbisiana]